MHLRLWQTTNTADGNKPSANTGGNRLKPIELVQSSKIDFPCEPPNLFDGVASGREAHSHYTEIQNRENEIVPA